MLYSILVGFIAYYGFLFAIGVLVNSIAIEGSLIALAAICFVGAYFARHNRLVRRIANGLGFACATLLVAQWVLLPILQGQGNAWVTIIAVIASVVCYTATRRHWHRRFLRRDPHTGDLPAPPFGREWARWLLAFIA